MFNRLEHTLESFRGCFSREATYGWFVVIVVGFLLRTDHLGMTSVVRDLALRSREEEYLNGILDPNRTMLESLFKAFMPESSKEMKDEDLRDWGNRSGLPKSLSLTTLAELYDSKLFAKEPWSGDLDYRGNGDDHDPLYLMMVMRAQTGNIAANLEATHQKLLANAMNQHVRCDTPPHYRLRTRSFDWRRSDSSLG